MVCLPPRDDTRAAYGYSPKSEGNQLVLQGSSAHRKFMSGDSSQAEVLKLATVYAAKSQVRVHGQRHSL